MVSNNTIIDESQDYFGIKPKYCLVIILLLSIFFRVFNISHTSLWTDELATYWASTAPTIHETIDRVAETQGQSPLYYLLERACLENLPEGEFSVRFLSLAASIISVYLMFLLGKQIFKDEHRALFASLVFAIHDTSVYYALEARPYSLGIMFALLSMIFFIRLFSSRSVVNLLLYTVFSVLTFYSHYVFASILLVQNIYYVYVLLAVKSDCRPSLIKWYSSQLVIALSIPLLLFQLSGMFSNRERWDWLLQLDFLGALALFISMFDPRVTLIFIGCFVVFYFIEKADFKSYFKGQTSQLVFLLTWLVVPFLFVFLVSKILHISLFDKRYMVLSMIPFYFLLSFLAHIFKSDVLRVAFPGAYLVIYLGMVSIPNYMTYGHFSYRITHNWRGAITFVNKNYKAGDVILLRSGFVNENWIPSTDNKIVQDYVKCPFKSYYWKKKKGVPAHPTIYSLTYTWEKDFYPYYDLIFGKAMKYDRIWVMGVNTPNTNYPLSNITIMLEKEHDYYKIYEASYAGVYLCLLSANPLRNETLSF
ncbi:MAG TPA: hypothetical protein DET40_11475 [Lentisphaeria bacterium]|nr:MAG: hypothetical protein A2X45_03535 [Lentisphaerae bacterium GWF2_50_93]HCE44160.1 hypothetical protein [Lentisphaeria bacterium]